MKNPAIILVLIPGAGCAHGAASDSNPLGFYLGGSVGRSDVRTTIEPLEPFAEFDEHATGWKLIAGMRPVSIFAAEFGYIDFGHPNETTSLEPYTSYSDILQRAPTFSGLFYLPIPVPIIGIYARAGVGWLESSGRSYSICSGLCPQIAPNIALLPTQINRTHTDFLYGAGLQLNLAALALRFEYECINDSEGSPDLLSAGLVWTF